MDTSSPWLRTGCVLTSYRMGLFLTCLALDRSFLTSSLTILSRTISQVSLVFKSFGPVIAPCRNSFSIMELSCWSRLTSRALCQPASQAGNSR
ncbi:hypothetical protein I7I48_02227 [Histoplasma ohiense]|nr:hypothetical protein I7I48_02227 [Histoplasma ohiense (nom. inval.)]